MMLLNSKTDYMGIWSHPIIIPIKIRDILERYRKYSPIKYDDYQSHVRFVPGRVRKNITNALCYILIVKSLKILDKEKVDLFSENSIPKPKRPKLGQTVEMKSGPFRGEKGKIVHIDEHHNELTIELIGLDALDLWALPITVKEEQIRIIN